MMESINFRTGISTLLLQTAQAALAEIPHKLHSASRNVCPLMRSRSTANRLGLIEADLPAIDLPAQTAEVEIGFNPSQWLLAGNPQLANLITQVIGDRWMTYTADLQQLAPLADDPLFQSRWRAVKLVNKQMLASYLFRSQGISINVSSLFDLQLQPIIEQQRQLLNILHIITLFQQIKQNPGAEVVPRTFIFGNLGELDAIDQDQNQDHQNPNSPVNFNREILLLIQALAKVLAADPAVNRKLQLVYIPNSAGLTNHLYAAADLTQEIAVAAIEDLDLNKLKAAVNGVVSIGSMGKTNYWLQQLVGKQNYICFGLHIPEIALFKDYGYDPYYYYKYYPEVRQVIDALLAGYFTPEQPHLCQSLIDQLFGADEQMVLADYQCYLAGQARVTTAYQQPSVWTKMSILNVAGVS